MSNGLSPELIKRGLVSTQRRVWVNHKVFPIEVVISLTVSHNSTTS